MRPLLLVTTCIVAGCTGLSLGENTPGGDTWVEPDPTEPGEHRMGAIAVERDEDQLWAIHEENRAGVIRAHLAAIDPETGATHAVLDVTDAGDRRVVFPSPDRMILLAELDGRDHLVLLDTTTRAPIATAVAPTWYAGTRTSPSGHTLIVADNAAPRAALHVIDTATLGYRVLDHGGDRVEAMWNHHEDVLLAISVTDPFTPEAVARLLRYDLREVDPAAPLPAPTVAWELAGYDWDYWFSYTWIGISPDDRWAVFPLIKRTAGPGGSEPVLLVLDQATGAVALVPGHGPVGFTRDGRWIVSYGARPDGGQDLWLIDPVTHDRRIVTMPFISGVSFAVARETDHIVCDPIGDGPLAIYDVTTETLRTIDAAWLDLWDYVTRPASDELWLETGGQIHVLSLSAATLERVPLGDTATGHINVRPTADQAVLADADVAAIRRIDMATRRVDGLVISLPSPFEVDAPAIWSSGRRGADARVQSPIDPRYRPGSRPDRPGLRRSAPTP